MMRVPQAKLAVTPTMSTQAMAATLSTQATRVQSAKTATSSMMTATTAKALVRTMTAIPDPTLNLTKSPFRPRIFLTTPSSPTSRPS